MSAFSTFPANTAETTRDFQERLGRFARSIGVISGVMLVASVLNNVAAADPQAAPISLPSRGFHVFATALAFVVWGLCRGKALAVATPCP